MATTNTCPDCGSQWADDVTEPGILHRTRLCDACVSPALVFDAIALDALALHGTLLQALREVAGDHLAVMPGDRIPTCAFCSADEGCAHEAECTMNAVLAAIDQAEGREPWACYIVGAEQPAVGAVRSHEILSEVLHLSAERDELRRHRDELVQLVSEALEALHDNPSITQIDLRDWIKSARTAIASTRVDA